METASSTNWCSRFGGGACMKNFCKGLMFNMGLIVFGFGLAQIGSGSWLDWQVGSIAKVQDDLRELRAILSSRGTGECRAHDVSHELEELRSEVHALLDVVSTIAQDVKPSVAAPPEVKVDSDTVERELTRLWGEVRTLEVATSLNAGATPNHPVPVQGVMTGSGNAINVGVSSVEPVRAGQSVSSALQVGTARASQIPSAASAQGPTGASRVDESIEAMRVYGNVDCWKGGFSWDICCHHSFGPLGNPDCWDRLHNAQTCCFSPRQRFTA
jgi:hypothetical protein